MQRTMNAAPVYRHGVPCWVDVLAPDPDAAARFYAELFGWEFQRHGRMPDGGTYLLATLGGDDVAGIAQKPAGAHAHWATYVDVDDVDAALAPRATAAARSSSPRSTRGRRAASR